MVFGVFSHKRLAFSSQAPETRYVISKRIVPAAPRSRWQLALRPPPVCRSWAGTRLEASCRSAAAPRRRPPPAPRQPRPRPRPQGLRLCPPARAGNRRFGLLSALRAHTKPIYCGNRLLWKTLRAIDCPGRARTVVSITSSPTSAADTQSSQPGYPSVASRAVGQPGTTSHQSPARFGTQPEPTWYQGVL